MWARQIKAEATVVALPRLRGHAWRGAALARTSRSARMLPGRSKPKHRVRQAAPRELPGKDVCPRTLRRIPFHSNQETKHNLVVRGSRLFKENLWPSARKEQIARGPLGRSGSGTLQARPRKRRQRSTIAAGWRFLRRKGRSSGVLRSRPLHR